MQKQLQQCALAERLFPGFPASARRRIGTAIYKKRIS
jgi:hypothetical protein